jgi:predicted nucleic acid-binding protein
MPKPRVYVESTIPSAYYTGRTDPGMIKRHLETRLWWDAAVHSCELVTSVAVRQEIEDGTSRHVPKRLAMLGRLRFLDIIDAVLETAAVYVRHKLMPANLFGDALHLALASHYKCDVLLTWNYNHLANQTQLSRIQRLNSELGLFVPKILTPSDMLEGDSWNSGL